MSDAPQALELAQLEELLARHGADLERFPARERAAARALIARDPRAARLVAEAAALERALSAVSAPVPSAALRRAVAEIPLRHPQPAAALWPLRPIWAFALAAAFAFALGGIAGSYSAAPGSRAGAPIARTDASPDAAFELEDDLAAIADLAFAAPLEEELAP